ncbi:hypothetical protein SEMRO_2396_G326040.1 [Seminavis robusta]|uniref:Uncharacterized protein n=1 Tax=Seminavis robusta TaxID=568900 RepID=A0A9N8HY60_9STRA|nr:hypothetical protein SEMRO_2396_G326040.1 [Seminavis robusta]|eukprot:Sro2396_g326040.1 n/a (406) ;mRNA; f:11898-13551
MLNVNEQEAQKYVLKLISRVQPRRWVFIPVNECDAAANNSLCTVSALPVLTIIYLFKQAGIFGQSTSTDGDLGIDTNTIDKLFERLNSRIKASWRLHKALGLDGKEKDVLFIIRGNPRVKDATPRVTPVLSEVAPLSSITPAKTPLQKLKLSKQTAEKLNEYWGVLVAEATTAKKPPTRTPLAPPLQSSPRTESRSTWLKRTGRRLSFSVVPPQIRTYPPPPQQVARRDEEHTTVRGVVGLDDDDSFPLEDEDTSMLLSSPVNTADSNTNNIMPIPLPGEGYTDMAGSSDSEERMSEVATDSSTPNSNNNNDTTEQQQQSQQPLAVVVEALQLKPVGNQRGCYTDNLEKEHPSYLIHLFREAQKLEGNKATWKEYADSINTISKLPHDERPPKSTKQNELSGARQ